MSETTVSIQSCPLCGKNNAEMYAADHSRAYFHCRTCELVFVPQNYWISPEEEKKIYDLHQNDVADPGYRSFLSRLAKPLLKKLSLGSSGLDFGCGPGPALARMLEEAGHKVALYDPYYQADTAALETSYDFICATEVVEHLRDPAQEFQLLFSRLQPAGILAIMTKLVRDQQAFAGWHYIRDLTHICFYSRETFIWLAEQYNARVEFIGSDVILLYKSQQRQKV